MKLKLNQTNCVLAKLRHYVNPVYLTINYYYLLIQYICYLLNPNWDLDVSYGEKHKFKSCKILKLKDIITISNLKFVYDQINKIFLC